MGLLKNLPLINKRRKELKQYFRKYNPDADLSESCIPSYVHGNLAASAISWWRLTAAADLFNVLQCPGPVLDFGASTGELAQILGNTSHYFFAELDDLPAAALTYFNPSAQRVTLDMLEHNFFSAVFALDSLEHNDDYENLISKLFSTIKPGGYFILSGPTENSLYRFGRFIAGFTGEYHVTNIYDLEKAVKLNGSRVRLRIIPAPLLPLFRISVWQKPQN